MLSSLTKWYFIGKESKLPSRAWGNDTADKVLIKQENKQASKQTDPEFDTQNLWGKIAGHGGIQL